MSEIRTIIGGSHIKYRRQMAVLKPFVTGLPIRRALYGKFFNVRLADTPEARVAVESCGARIDKKWKPIIYE